MLKEELPAIISFALIVIVFWAVFWQDMRRVRSCQVRSTAVSSKSEGARPTSTTNPSEEF
jgi:hypothetical protein